MSKILLPVWCLFLTFSCWAIQKGWHWWTWFFIQNLNDYSKRNLNDDLTQRSLHLKNKKSVTNVTLRSLLGLLVCSGTFIVALTLSVWLWIHSCRNQEGSYKPSWDSICYTFFLMKASHTWTLYMQAPVSRSHTHNIPSWLALPAVTELCLKTRILSKLQKSSLFLTYLWRWRWWAQCGRAGCTHKSHHLPSPPSGCGQCSQSSAAGPAESCN